MSTRPITDELVRQVIEDLRSRYSLDDEDVRLIGERLAGSDRATRRADNEAFGRAFVAEHAATFDRLSQ